MLIFLYVVIKLFEKFKGQDIVDISEFLGGKFLKIIIGIFFVVYFIIISATHLRNFCEILKLSYFSEIPISFLIILFLFVAVIANRFGESSVIKMNLIIVPLVMLNLLVAFFCVAPSFVPENLLPIFGDGINETFLTGISNIFAFTGLSYIYFLQPLLEDSKDFKKISFLGMGISAIYLLLSITSLLLSFVDLSSINEISPIYLLVRGADWGRFIQRPDSVFFLGWILCMMSYLSVTILLANRIVKKISNIKSNFILIYPISLLIFIIAILPGGMLELRFIENSVFKIITLSLVFGISFLILVFASIKSNISSKESGMLNA